MPLFPSTRDVDFWKKKNIEVYSAFFQPVKLYKYRAQEYDNIYNEDYNKVFDGPYEIPGYLAKLPTGNLEQTRFGLDESRDMRICFSLDLLQVKNLPTPEIGDHLEIQGDRYKIMQTNPIDYRSNLQIPLTHVCDLSRVRPEIPEQGTILTKEY